MRPAQLLAGKTAVITGGGRRVRPPRGPRECGPARPHPNCDDRGDADAYLGTSLAPVPMGRPSEPSEVASVTNFLTSDMSIHVTGPVLGITGGRYGGGFKDLTAADLTAVVRRALLDQSNLHPIITNFFTSEPGSRIRATCSVLTSSTWTGTPARVSLAPVSAPRAPAPTTSTRILSSALVFDDKALGMWATPACAATASDQVVRVGCITVNGFHSPHAEVAQVVAQPTKWLRRLRVVLEGGKIVADDDACFHGASQGRESVH
jgi:hypothetical protein